MSAKKKQPSALKRLALVVEQVAMKVLDRHEIADARLAEVENRLARIDAGEDAAAAITAAYAKVRDRRDAGGKRPLSVVLQRVDGRLAFVARPRAESQR